MSKEPSVPPYVLQSPPFSGATYQHRPDGRGDGTRLGGANGSTSNGATNGATNGAPNGRAGGGNGAAGTDHADAGGRDRWTDGSGNGNGTTAAPKASIFDQFWSRFRPARGVKPNGEVNESEDDEAGSGVVHSITKKTDYWFDREVFTL